ncbi:MAG TPA: hypothetical protein VJ827_00965 [Rubrobacter sp.]|nr:hypothetical protein [Rubrobacter sp.]
MKKKLMVMVATLALMVAMASPSFAQAIGGDFTVKVWDASQTQAAAATQAQHGDTTATADSTAGRFASAAQATADAAIDQSLTIDQLQENGGF